MPAWEPQLGQKARVFAHIMVCEGLWRRSQGVANLLGGATLGEEVDRLRLGQPPVILNGKPLGTSWWALKRSA